MKSIKSLSQAVRNNMSVKRKAWLAANPDKHPWKNKNKFISEPCEKLKGILRDRGISFLEEFQPLLNQSRFFSIDITIPEKKIGIEVNGSQHYERDGSLKPYYQERHNLIEAAGWKLYEIHYLSVYDSPSVEKIIDSIKNEQNKPDLDLSLFFDRKEKRRKENEAKLTRKKNRILEKEKISNKIINLHKENKDIREIGIEMGLSTYIILRELEKSGILCQFRVRQGSEACRISQRTRTKKKHKIITKKEKKIANKIKPKKEDLEKEVWETPVQILCKKYNMSDRGLSKWCRRLSIPTPPRGYWTKIHSGVSKEEALKPTLKVIKDFTFNEKREQRLSFTFSLFFKEPYMSIGKMSKTYNLGRKILTRMANIFVALFLAKYFPQ